MLSLFARIWAKWKYRFELLHEAYRTEINAQLAENRAAEVRTLVTQLRAKADDMENRIKEYAEKEEKGFWLCEKGHETSSDCSCARPGDIAIVHVEGCHAEPSEFKKCPQCGAATKFIKRSEMTGQEKYESDKERKDAETMAEQNRQLATEKEKTAEGGEQTAKTFRAQAENARLVAEKIRNL